MSPRAGRLLWRAIYGGLIGVGYGIAYGRWQWRRRQRYLLTWEGIVEKIADHILDRIPHDDG